LTSYNKVILIGDLVKSPDTLYTPSGSRVTKLALQINPDEGSRETRDPQIIDVIAFESGSDRQGRSLSKGCWVLVEGRIQTRSWKTLEGQKRTKMEIIAERIYPLKDEKSLRS
jgi:single-strand DNA-binding protein